MSLRLVKHGINKIKCLFKYLLYKLLQYVYEGTVKIWQTRMAKQCCFNISSKRPEHYLNDKCLLLVLLIKLK